MTDEQYAQPMPLTPEELQTLTSADVEGFLAKAQSWAMTLEPQERLVLRCLAEAAVRDGQTSLDDAAAVDDVDGYAYPLRELAHRSTRLAGAALIGAGLLAAIGCSQPTTETQSLGEHTAAAYEITTPAAEEQRERAARSA